MPTSVRIVFFVVLAAVVIVAHVYIYRRLVRDVTEHRGLRRFGAVVVVMLGAAGVVARPLARALPEEALRPAVLVLLFWLGFVLYLLLALLVADFGRWAVERLRRAPRVPESVDPARRRVLAAGVSVASSLVAGGVASFGTYRAFEAPEVHEVPIRLPGLPKALDGLRIVQLSDIHIGAVIQAKFIEDMVERTNAQRPDLVAITGDLVDGSVETLGRFAAPLQRLRSRYGTWFVTGNHDYYSGADEWVDAIKGLGIQSLRNRRVEIGDAGGSIDLLGVDDWRSRDHDLDKAIAGRSPDRASVLLAHQPTNLEAVAKARIGLQLSGHTHGGQIFPGNGVARLIWGARSAGYSKYEDTHVYVSRGCGFVGPPMRVGSPPEIAVLVLER